MSDEPPHSLREVIDQLIEKTDGTKVTLQELIDAVGSRSYGPLLLLPAMLVVFPTGAIPGMPLFVAIIIILIAGQMVVSRSRPWLPRKLLSYEFPRQRMVDHLEKAKRWVKPIDAVTSRRWTALTSGPVVIVVAMICIGLAVLMIPLGVIPVAVAMPGAAVAFFACGLTARDGLVIAIGLVFTGLCVGLGWWLLV